MGDQRGQLLKARGPETRKLVVSKTPCPEQLAEISSPLCLSEQGSQETKTHGSVFPARSHLVQSTQAAFYLYLDLEPKDIV